jgi:2'-5' RNA ligase
MRLFIAIDVPDAIKEHLSFLQRSLDFPGLRPVHPKNIHLTLNFLGEQGNVQSIINTLHTIPFSPFILNLDQLGVFPHEQDPQVLWVGLKENKDLSHLQRQIDVYFTPKKSFKAHLTLARTRHIPPQEKQRILKSAQQLTIKPLSFKVHNFKLYKSTLTALGPVYEVLETFPARH